MARRVVFFSLLVVFGVGAIAQMALAGDRHNTKTTIRLSGSLVVSGDVWAVDGTHACQVGRSVLIQKRGDGGGWQTVGNGRTLSTGNYRISVPDADGSYRTFVKKRELAGGGVCTSAESRVVSHGGGGGGGSSCTPGYSPCLVYHGGADYDCSGGSGNGPYYTAPGVTYTVSGSDPYGLDADNDGYGCE